MRAAKIGFSTGAIAQGDFKRALGALSHFRLEAVELSALRLNELDPLLESLDDLPLDGYSYISVHAPTRFSAADEVQIVEKLQKVFDRGWPIVVHPDAMIDHRRWKALASLLCFENMDKRKPIGRTADELDQIFAEFACSSLCFDIGHASQIDRTMSEACLIGQRFERRIRQIHISEVNTRSEHVGLSASSEFAYRKVFDRLAVNAPLIIESVIEIDMIEKELSFVREICDRSIEECWATD